MQLHSIVEYGMILRIHSKTSTVQPLKFSNGQVISSHICLAYDRLSMLELKLTDVSKMIPCTGT